MRVPVAKQEPNGTYLDRAGLGMDGAGPALAYYEVPALFARLHAGFVNIHPFYDGNGRLARLLANVPLLNGGLPPLLFAAADRPEYMLAAARHAHAVGQIDLETGVWPADANAAEFEAVCRRAYGHVREIIANALRCQAEAEAKRAS